jgi:hypothetical protein
MMGVMLSTLLVMLSAIAAALAAVQATNCCTAMDLQTWQLAMIRDVVTGL